MIIITAEDVPFSVGEFLMRLDKLDDADKFAIDYQPSNDLTRAVVPKTNSLSMPPHNNASISFNGQVIAVGRTLREAEANFNLRQRRYKLELPNL